VESSNGEKKKNCGVGNGIREYSKETAKAGVKGKEIMRSGNVASERGGGCVLEGDRGIVALH